MTRRDEEGYCGDGSKSLVRRVLIKQRSYVIPIITEELNGMKGEHVKDFIEYTSYWEAEPDMEWIER